MAHRDIGKTEQPAPSHGRHLPWRWIDVATGLATVGVCAVACSALAVGVAVRGAVTAHTTSPLHARSGQGSMPSVHPNQARAAISGRPLNFEANLGQAPDEVQYLAYGPAYAIELTGQGAALAFGSQSSRAEQVIRLRLQGASHASRPMAEEPLPGRVNYFIGNDPSKWHTNVATYSKVRYGGVYPGIDLVYYGAEGKLEYDFAVAPGSDAKAIGLKFVGARHLRVDAQGNLKIQDQDREIAFQRPVAYQTSDAGQRSPVRARYRLHGTAVRFEVGAYDHSRQLTIDPVLSYFSYLGGSGYDVAGIATPTSSPYYTSGQAAALDSAGDLYVTGYTNSTNFPTQSAFAPPPAKANPNGGQSWTFVTKFAPDAKTLIFSTYLGGTLGNDRAASIAVDSSGNAIVAGVTESDDFPVTTGAYQTVCSPVFSAPNVETPNCTVAGATAAFVSKFSPSGALLDSTFLSGTNTNTAAYAVAVDTTGRAYVAGQTLPGSIVPAGAPFSQAIPFPTTAGAVLVTPPFSTGVSGYQNVLSAQPDAFISVFDPTLSTLVYSSLFGEPQVSNAGLGFHGASFTVGQAVTVDAMGNFYLAGTSQDASLETTTGAYEANASSCGTVTSNTLVNCAFVAKFSPVAAGTPGVIYGTYLGHDGNSSYGVLMSGIATDAAGDAYVTGFTNQTVFPTTPGAYQGTCNYQVNGNPSFTCGSAFISKLNPSGTSLLASTYFGGYYAGANAIADNVTSMGPIALDAAGNVYITGVAADGLPQLNGFSTNNGTGGVQSPFVAELDSSLTTLKFSTLFSTGGISQLGVDGLALDTSGAIYVAGSVNSPPTSAATVGAFQAAYGGGSSDGFVAKILVTPPPVATSTALTATPGSAVSGAAVMLSATVTPASGGGVPTGMVTFSDGTTALGTGTLSGTGVAMYTASALSVGTHSITAAYGGDSGDTASTSSAVTVTITAPPPAAAPTGVAATAGNAQVGLTWMASTGATSYNVYQGTSAGGEGKTAVQTGIAGTSATLTSLANGTTYYFTVAAVNANGTSSPSSEVSATPAAPSTGGGGGGGGHGGGGAFSLWTLLALLVQAFFTLIRRQRGLVGCE
jgi:hypothetical protein